MNNNININNVRLDTLEEEDPVTSVLTRRMLETSLEESDSPKNEGRATSPYSNGGNASMIMTKSRRGSISSNSVSTNSKMVGLGLARRPSDNLLLNMVAMEEINGPSLCIGNSGLPPPRKHFVTRCERPISNDSIATRTTELFSSTSSDVNSGSSSIDNETDANKERRNESSMVSQSENDSGSFTEDESILEMASATNTSTLNQMSTFSPADETICSVAAPDTSSADENAGSDAISHNNSSVVTPPAQRTRYLFANGTKAKSQISFGGSSSTVSSPLKPSDNSTLQNLPLPSASTLYGHSNSTSAILPSKTRLTPSQRYRLRKAQNETALRKSIRRKEKFYEEQETNLELQEGDINNSFIWNIPTASFSTNSFVGTSRPKGVPRRASDGSLAADKNSPINRPSGSSSGASASALSFLDTYEMPTSPIPGVDRTSDFQYMQQASKNLSHVYQHSSNRLSKSKLSERTTSADFLPLEFKAASDLGLEHLVLVSENKLEVTSHSRPSWLPPKDPEERKLHEKQISKSTSMASIEQLDRNKEREERAIKNETNRQKYVLLLDRGITRYSSLQSLKKIVWETAFTHETRYLMYDELLQSSVKLVTGKYLESFDQMIQLLNRMDFPRGKEAEIEQLIENGIRSKVAGNEKVSSDLLLMLQLKSISPQGLIPGDELLFHHFLLSDSFQSLKQVWETVNLIQATCFNDLCKEKYDSRILNSRGVVAHYLLRGDDFKNEFNSTSLNSTTWWNVLERVDHSLFMWIIDIIVVANSQCYKKYPISKEDFDDKSWDYYRSKRVVINYKIMLSFVLNVLLNYHFGFNDLKSLSSLKDKQFSIPTPMDYLIDTEVGNGMFIRKWLHYYKKF